MGKTLENPSKIPTTGRIGRWARIIEEETSQDTAEKVLQGADQFKSLNNTEKAAWIRGAVEKLEKLIGQEKTRKIMESCGRKCCGPTSRKKAKQLMDESDSLEEFIRKLNEKGLGGGRLTLHGDTITGGYDHCYCGQVKQTKEPFLTLTYCSCSAGWYKQLFESALGKPVEVELLQSIICGADTCEFTICIGGEKNE